MLGLVAPIARLLNAAVAAASGSSLPRFGWFSGLPRSLAQLWRQGRQVSLSVCLSRTESPELVTSHDGGGPGKFGSAKRLIAGHSHFPFLSTTQDKPPLRSGRKVIFRLISRDKLH
jgi:hypothetical protein